MTTATTLTERAMVMTLSIGIWKGYRLDKAATAKITTESGADADAARVNKHLVDKSTIAPVNTAANAIRAHFYDNTLPWRDNGDRLMTRALYFKFIEEHEALVAKFRAAVDKLLDEDYKTAVAKAEFRMGTLFNRDDYPSTTELRRKFYVDLSIDAIPTANDFRVQMDAEEVDKVRAKMQEAAEARIHKAMADVWQRIADVIGNFLDRMSDPDAIFRNSTVTNITELLELIPGLNVLDDPDIEAVRAQIKAKLSNLDPEGIRKDPAHRAELAGEAKEIMDRMSGFMRAFGAE